MEIIPNVVVAQDIGSIHHEEQEFYRLVSFFFNFSSKKYQSRLL